MLESSDYGIGELVRLSGEHGSMVLMNVNDVAKILGLQARQFRAERHIRERPSQELMHFWFINRVGLVHKKDVAAFDAWMRSSDGVEPHPSPNSFQHSTFPPSQEASMSFDNSPHDVFQTSKLLKEWAISLKGLEKLAANCHRLPPL